MKINRKLGLITFLFIAAFSLSANEYKTYVRSSDYKIVEQSIEFGNLMKGSILENEYFKVCYKTENEAFDLESSKYTEEEKLKAASVFYHLNIAREKMIELTNSDFIKNMEQRVARIEVTGGFSPFVKFNTDENYNNSLTIPASSLRKLDEVADWSDEIWFRPKKKVEIDNIVKQSTDVMLNSAQSKTEVLSLTDQMLSSMVRDYAVTEEFNAGASKEHFQQILLTYFVMKSFPYIVNKIATPFKSSTFLDTAAVPDIVYHEYIHLSLSDYVSTRIDSSIAEGFANYFAGIIANHRAIGDKTGGHAKNAEGPTGKWSNSYRSEMELKGQEHNGMTYAFLVQVRDEIINQTEDKVEGEKLANQIIFNTRQYLKFNTSPMRDLTNALRLSINNLRIPQKRLYLMCVQKVGAKFGI